MPAPMFAHDDLDRCIGIPEAAARLGVSARTGYRMAADGDFPVAVIEVRGRLVVSLRHLAEWMYGGPIDADTSAGEQVAS